MVWHPLKKTRPYKSNLLTRRLNIANVFGSILHNLIYFALHGHGASPQWIRLIEIFYKWILSKSFFESATKD